MDNMGDAGKRKLVSICFCSVLTIFSKENVILQKFPSIFNFWLSTLALVENRGDHLGYDNFISSASNEELSEFPYERERMKCYLGDPINTVNLRDLINKTLEKLKGSLGDHSFNLLISSVDPKLIEEFKKPKQK